MKIKNAFSKVALAISCLVIPFTSQAADVSINLGYTGAKGSPYTVFADKFEELAEKYTNGTVDIKVRCCGQLVTEDEAFKALQLGTVDMTIMAMNNISPHYPLMDIFVLPYIFQNKAHADKIVNGEVGKKFSEDFSQKTKVHLLAYGGFGYRDFYNSVRPVNSVEDMKGLKVRTPKNEVMLETFKAFGASPVPIAWADTPTALQTGTVVGADNGTSFIKSQKFYEIADHLTVLNHFSYFTPLLASSRVMKKLSPEQTAAIQKAASEASQHQDAVIAKETEEVRTFLGKEGGMAVTRPDPSSFITAALTVQDKIAAKKSEAFRALLEEIRAEAK
ncbi:MAG: TRAP transporter substrate-binding protein [Arenicella sp.]